MKTTLARDDSAAEDKSEELSGGAAAGDLDETVKALQEGLQQQVDAFRSTRTQVLDAAPAGNLQRLQDLLNQVQIDNKNFVEENRALKLRLESKDRLVAHLENKVTHIMLENEETLLKLKSEIVLLKNQIDTNGESTTKQLLLMRERVETENEKANGQMIRDLTAKSEKLLRENGLQASRIE